MIPKCTSWRGHKFEGRWSKDRAVIDSFKSDKITARGLEIVMEGATKRTYECDICVRCGHRIEKNDPSQ